MTNLVPSEHLNVLLYPSQSLRLVPQSVVPRHHGISSGEKAERADAVVERHDDHAFRYLETPFSLLNLFPPREKPNSCNIEILGEERHELGIRVEGRVKRQMGYSK